MTCSARSTSGAPGERTREFTRPVRSHTSALAGRHDFSAFTDKRLKEDESRIVVVERADLAEAGDLILFRIEASHFLWKMVRKLVSFLVETGRGTEDGDFSARYGARGEAWSPTAPPSGLFLEAILYEGETYEQPLTPIVPVTVRMPMRPRGNR